MRRPRCVSYKTRNLLRFVQLTCTMAARSHVESHLMISTRAGIVTRTSDGQMGNAMENNLISATDPAR
jgi:hypothetical protein